MTNIYRISLRLNSIYQLYFLLRKEIAHLFSDAYGIKHYNKLIFSREKICNYKSHSSRFILRIKNGLVVFLDILSLTDSGTVTGLIIILRANSSNKLQKKKTVLSCHEFSGK